MKLLVVLVNILLFPITLPFAVGCATRDALRNRRWRKAPQVGDMCWFPNIMGGKTVAKVTRCEGDGACISTEGFTGDRSYSSGWYKLSTLNYLPPATFEKWKAKRFERTARDFARKYGSAGW